MHVCVYFYEYTYMFEWVYIYIYIYSVFEHKYILIIDNKSDFLLTESRFFTVSFRLQPTFMIFLMYVTVTLQVYWQLFWNTSLHFKKFLNEVWFILFLIAKKLKVKKKKKRCIRKLISIAISHHSYKHWAFQQYLTIPQIMLIFRHIVTIPDQDAYSLNNFGVIHDFSAMKRQFNDIRFPVKFACERRFVVSGILSQYRVINPGGYPF